MKSAALKYQSTFPIFDSNQVCPTVSYLVLILTLESSRQSALDFTSFDVLKRPSSETLAR